MASNFSPYYIYLMDDAHTFSGSETGPAASTVTATNYQLVPNETFTVGSTIYTYKGTATAGGLSGFYASTGGKNYFFSSVRASDKGYTATLHSGTDYNLCFYPGTLIRTPEGDVAVETLQIGDLVLTSDGKAMPVRWIGRQTVATLFADPLHSLPIRITAGALGENQPVRDLLVSPGHALLVDEVLIHAGALVNGATIRREQDLPNVFTYYHVELADHSLILAEGVPAETFVDNADRAAFDNWEEHLALYPEGCSIAELPLPRAKAHRQVPTKTRERLAARSAYLMNPVVAVA